MDATTTKMCADGKGRYGYARVLVEVDSKKGFFQEIELNYKDNNNLVTIVKTVKVEYMWKPLVCATCNVFGHNCQLEKVQDCVVNEAEEGEIMSENCHEEKGIGIEHGIQEEVAVNVDSNGKTSVVHKIANGKAGKIGDGKATNSRGKRKEVQGEYQSTQYKKVGSKNGEYRNGKRCDQMPSTNKTPTAKSWNVKDDVMAAMKRSANKYVVLNKVGEEVLQEDHMSKKYKEVDKFLFLKKIPTKEERNKWGRDMNSYFDRQWNAMINKNINSNHDIDSMEDVEEVEKVYHDSASFLNANEVGDGMRGREKGGTSNHSK